MKKNLLLFGVLAAACCGTGVAQSKINGAGRIMLDTYQTQVRARSVAEAPSVLALVTLNDGYEASDLEAEGYTITNKVGDMAMVRVSLDLVEELAAMDAVKSVSFGSESRPHLDVARQVTNVDVIHNGTGDGLEGHSYTGKGVTVGLYDTGLDPNHAAFRDANGNTRVRAIYVRRTDDKSNQDIVDEKDILAYTTEATGESHGTHVLGIMAGTNSAEGLTPSKGSGKIPFYGPSYESDIVIGCGDFIDNCILDGIASVVNKAKEIGQPAVVNLSLGSNSGAHDPNSDRSKFIDALGKDAIICISAGNEGETPLAITHKFMKVAALAQLNTFMASSTGDLSKPLTYITEFWGENEKPFNLNIVVYDRSTSKVIETYPVTKGQTVRVSPANSAAMKDQYDSSSYLTATADVDKATGRYNVYMVGNIQQSGGDPVYRIGVNLTGDNGYTVNGYISTISKNNTAVFSAEGVSGNGYKNGVTDGTINGFGCGHNIISVGAFVSRTSAPYVETGSYAGTGKVGDLASFSSYGKTADGRQLPHVCGPGAQVVSSVSTYWMQNVMSSAIEGKRYNAYSSANGRDSYWYPMQGTSMSSPFVAGVIGLWLQAWPDMTVQQCHDIIDETSINDRFTGSGKARWGAGKIDALAGLKLAIYRNASLGNVQADRNEQNLVIENLGGRRYSVSYVGADNVAVNVYNIQGAQVLASADNSDTVEFDASALTDGIYVVNVVTPDGSYSRKLAVK